MCRISHPSRSTLLKCAIFPVISWSVCIHPVQLVNHLWWVAGLLAPQPDKCLGGERFRKETTDHRSKEAARVKNGSGGEIGNGQRNYMTPKKWRRRINGNEHWMTNRSCVTDEAKKRRRWMTGPKNMAPAKFKVCEKQTVPLSVDD